MPFCKKCGESLDIDAVFCSECGTPVVKTGNTGRNITKFDEGSDSTRILVKKPEYGILRLDSLPKDHIIDERYVIQEKVGQGGFGAVYRVFDKIMNIDKALKVIPETIISDKEAMLDLQREAQTMIALNHPNIVRVYDFHRTGNIKFIDMEYIDGSTLSEMKLNYSEKKIPEELVKEYALKIAEGMAYAHLKGVLHKDLKPHNVKVTEDGSVKIMDFGISETVRTSLSRLEHSSSSGTLVYMSPEQLEGKNVGKESDVYSFGVLLYELLTGNPPFYKGAIEHQILSVPPTNLPNSISSSFNLMIMKCLEKNYYQRYRNFDEVLSAINATHHKPKDITEPIFGEITCSCCNYAVSINTRICPKCGNVISPPYNQSNYRYNTGDNSRSDSSLIINRDNLIYPKNPPLSPHLSWLTILCTGLPHWLYGQTGKGFLWLGLALVGLLLGGIGWIVVDIIAIIDAYKVGKKLASGKPVGKWEWFPN